MRALPSITFVFHQPMLTLRLWPTLFVLGVAALTLRLGFWQLHRAQEKEARTALYARYAALDPLPIGSTLLAIEDVIAKPVQVEGYFVPKHTVYLDNRPYQGAPGFQVITPLRIDETALSLRAQKPGQIKNLKPYAKNTEAIAQSKKASYVLINRGWLPRNIKQRTALAPYDTPTGKVHIQGIALAYPGRLFTLGQSRPENKHTLPASTSPDIRQNILPAAYQLETGLAIQPFIIEQHSALNDHLIRDWLKPSQGIERHYGYMVQWWGLTVTVLGFGLYCALRRQPGAARNIESKEQDAV